MMFLIYLLKLYVKEYYVTFLKLFFFRGSIIFFVCIYIYKIYFFRKGNHTVLQPVNYTFYYTRFINIIIYRT